LFALAGIIYYGENFQTMNALVLPFLVMMLVVQVYLLPYFAVVNKCQSCPSTKLPKLMFILNVVFGWTIIGWLILMAMALALPKLSSK
jgi:hypothetical protein